ncbi:hypothetical protein MYE70_10665 [Marinobacter alexandrii]|uniref:DnaT-like ssDNA-binding protein n=1 Tax=Marinobacter alexandrii TaxID=2570351 RepID=UPI001FFFEB36|nr:DnaT-like ssDNA-binding protein [Marinobacter alexandrii]MCK2149528.1 hypothetical protein [Marinobacter alexandrii]
MPGYGDDAGFQAYADANGYTVPAGTVAAARLRGSVYLDGHYYRRWPGQPTDGIDQERSWPRKGAVDRYGNAIPSSEVPQRVINASYEAALLEMKTPGFFSKTFTEAERKVLTQVQNIRWTVTGESKGDRANSLTSTVIDNILAPILVPNDLPAALIVS